mgnify:CR=1 FL=1
MDLSNIFLVWSAIMIHWWWGRGPGWTIIPWLINKSWFLWPDLLVIHSIHRVKQLMLFLWADFSNLMPRISIIIPTSSTTYLTFYPIEMIRQDYLHRIRSAVSRLWCLNLSRITNHLMNLSTCVKSIWGGVLDQWLKLYPRSFLHPLLFAMFFL